MRVLARAILYFYAVGFGLGALVATTTTPLLVPSFGVAAMLCAWAAHRPSVRSITALAVVPLVIAPGILPLADPLERRDALLTLAGAELLWGGLCLAVSGRLRRSASAP